MPILTEISVNRTCATLLFDDRTHLTVRKSDLAACPVQVGDEVDTDAYAGRVCAHQFKDSFDAALSILDYSARTQREIEKKLLAKGFLPDCVSAVLERLRETRLIDDREIALRAAEFASAGKTGIYALKRKLRAAASGNRTSRTRLKPFPMKTSSQRPRPWRKSSLPAMRDATRARRTRSFRRRWQGAAFRGA